MTDIDMEYTAVTENKDREKAREVIERLRDEVAGSGTLIYATIDYRTVRAALSLLERYAPGGGR